MPYLVFVTLFCWCEMADFHVLARCGNGAWLLGICRTSCLVFVTLAVCRLWQIWWLMCSFIVVWVVSFKRDVDCRDRLGSGKRDKFGLICWFLCDKFVLWFLSCSWLLLLFFMQLGGCGCGWLVAGGGWAGRGVGRVLKCDKSVLGICRNVVVFLTQKLVQSGVNWFRITLLMIEGYFLFA